MIDGRFWRPDRQGLVDADAEVQPIDARLITDINKTFQTCVAAKTVKVTACLLSNLPAWDLEKITLTVLNFLLAAGWAPPPCDMGNTLLALRSDIYAVSFCLAMSPHEWTRG